MDDLRDPVTESLVVEEARMELRASSSNSSLWLALDQGGHASRALVFDSQGRELLQAFAPISTQHRGEDRIEHDAREIVESLRLVIADIAHSLGNDVQRIAAAGLATQRSSIVCWDARDGTPLSPVLSWQDRRNVALVNSLNAHHDEIQQLTGLVLSPHYGASKLRWCLDELPIVRHALNQRLLHCGPLASYLLYELLNEHPHVVDPANASRTQLWSPATGEWSTQLLEWFGVPAQVLPRPVATLHRYGHVQVGKQAVPLTVCTGDQAAVPFANGALQSNTVYLNAGTGAFLLAPISHDISTAAPLLRSVLFSDSTQTQFALEGTVNGAGGALHWFGERSAIDVQRALPLLQSPHHDRHIPLFINAVGGVGSPHWLPSVQPEFVNVADHGDEQAALIAVIESIAFLITDNIKLMRMHLPALNQVITGGGVSASDYLCQCIASLTELKLNRTSEKELTAKGLAWLIADQPAQWRQDTGEKPYLPADNSSLKTRYQCWKQEIAKRKFP